jgi:tripartite-type tricarboxylate transporter receptor subunit TctC
MRKHQVTRRLLPALAAAGIAGLRAAAAQPAWPDRIISMVLPFAPGGPADLIGRMFAQKLGTALGRPIVFENRPGAGGTIGSAYVARATPNGYTLLFGASSTQAIVPALYRNLSYDPLRSFLPIAQVSTSPLLLLVNPGLPVRSVQELVAHGRAHPGALNFGSAGNGTPSHLGMARLNLLTGIEATHVPFRSGGEALTALLQGQIQYLLDATISSMRHIEAGTLRLLAVASEQRSTIFPEVPTAIEAGVPGYEMAIWNGLLAPAGTPRPIVARLFEATRQALSDPDLLESFARSDTRAVGSDPEQFAQTIEREAAMWRDLVARLDLHLD